MPVPSITHEHSVEAIRERLEHGPEPRYPPDWVYGGVDGGAPTLAPLPRGAPPPPAAARPAAAGRR